MKATITFEIDADDVCKILDKIHQQHKEDQKDWEENHPHPLPPFMTDEPIKKTKPN